MKRKDTDHIEKELRSTDSYNRFLKENGKSLMTIHPGEYILEQIAQKKLEKKDIINAVNLNVSYVYEIFRKEKRPERDKMLQFAFALNLDIQETQSMLKRCGYALLYARNHRDSVIIFCLGRKKSLIDTNLYLDRYAFKTL